MDQLDQFQWQKYIKNLFFLLGRVFLLWIWWPNMLRSDISSRLAIRVKQLTPRDQLEPQTKLHMFLDLKNKELE